MRDNEMSNDESFKRLMEIRWFKWLIILSMIYIIIITIFFPNLVIECKAISERDLKYHETDFTSYEWFEILQNVIINTTTNKMYLNSTYVEGFVDDDFTEYNENDGLGSITVNNATQVSMSNADYRDNINTWLVKDKTGEMNDFRLRMRLNVGAIASSTTIIRATILANCDTLEDSRYAISNNLDYFGVYISSSSSTTDYFLNLFYITGGASTGSPTGQIFNINTNYYLELEKIDTHLWLEIYSDSDYTNILGNLTHTLPDDWNMKYFYPIQNVGYPTSLNTRFYIYDLKWYGENYEVSPIGYAYTKNLLENETDKAFSIFTNATLGLNTELSVWFSDDNSTWVESLFLDETGFDYKNIEYLNYTSLYAKFELSSDGINNIEVNSFWFTNLKSLTGDIVYNNEWFMLLFFICVPALIILGIILFKRRY